MRQRCHAWIWWTSKWGVKLIQTNSRQSALIYRSPLWYPALGKPPLHLVGLKQKRQESFTILPPPHLTVHLALSLPTHTHAFPIHTHAGLSFESLGLDLKFLFRACHAFYMHGEWERERRDCVGLQPKWTSLRCWSPQGCIYTHTHHFLSLLTPHFPSPTQLFQH